MKLKDVWTKFCMCFNCKRRRAKRGNTLCWFCDSHPKTLPALLDSRS